MTCAAARGSAAILCMQRTLRNVAQRIRRMFMLRQRRRRVREGIEVAERDGGQQRRATARFPSDHVRRQRSHIAARGADDLNPIVAHRGPPGMRQHQRRHHNHLQRQRRNGR